MFQNCTIQMLMDQQNIIHKQRETTEKKKHQLTKLKQKHTKTTEELEKNTETIKQTEETKKSFKIICPLCKDETFDLNNPTNYNRHLKKCKVVQEKKKAKEEKKIEKQKVKMYIFSTEYIFLKPKDQTNEHEQKNK